jgi:hypothetical protein
MKDFRSTFFVTIILVAGIIIQAPAQRNPSKTSAGRAAYGYPYERARQKSKKKKKPKQQQARREKKREYRKRNNWAG